MIGFDIENMGYVQHPDAQLILQDIRTIDGMRLRDAKLIVASTPCQEFSLHGMKCFHPNPPHPLLGISLFEHAQRIAQEAGCPIVLENVRAARQFVGKSKAHIGAFHLWGDVPALLPIISGKKDHSCKATKKTLKDGRVISIGWGSGKDLAGKTSSGSAARREVSARYALIPFELAKHVGGCFL